MISIAYLSNTNLEKFDIVKLLQYLSVENNASARPFLKNAIKHVLDFQRSTKQENPKNLWSSIKQ